MSDDKIKTVYMCQICHTEYDTREKAERCVKSHESDKYFDEIELSFYLANTKKYGFHETKFKKTKDYVLHDKVDIFCFYGGYPRLIVECIDTPDDILAAKRRLIAAAYEWAGKYKEVVAGLERELEVEK